VIVIEVGGAFAGATYRPEDETVPTVELPPTVAFTSQVTAVFEVPETVTENCSGWPVCRLALVGVMETLTLWLRPLC